MRNIFKDADFIDDEEKMYDFVRLTKEEFMQSYSYLINVKMKMYKNANSKCTILANHF